MKTKKLKIVYLSIVAISVLIIGGSLYFIYESLGGFEEVEIYKLESTKRTVVGKHFKTRYTDKALEDQYFRCRELIAKADIDGELTVINYQNELLSNNEIEQFIGIILKDDIAEIPIDFEVREFESKIRYVVFLSMHPLVRPTSKEVESLLFAQAQEDGAEFEKFFFELHYQDNSMSLEGWVK